MRKAVLGAAAVSIAALSVWLLPPQFSGQARLALFAFAIATMAFVASRLSAAFVALSAALFLTIAGVLPQDVFIAGLGADVVWLMIGAFILGEAINATGLAARMTRAVTARARRIDHLFCLVSLGLLPLTAVIPSTSGRAAVVLPLLRSLEDAMRRDAQCMRALALLMPAVILVTTTATLTGAASHLLANDLLRQSTGHGIGFAAWLAYGLPFAAAAGAMTCFAVLRLFLTPEQRARPLAFPRYEAVAWTRAEGLVLLVGTAMFMLWMSESWHGLRIALVAMLGALVIVSPVGPLKWKAGVAAVNWDLVLFVAGALLLGRAVIDTGAARALIDMAVAGIAQAGLTSKPALLTAIALLTCASHLVMTSHAARTAALIPSLIVVAQAFELNIAAMVFIGTVGINYCLTLPTSSKALLLFQGVENGLQPADLIRLSAVLAPLYLLFMLLFYAAYWRHVGLAL